MDERSDRTKIDADFVLQGITRNIARCEQGSPVVDRSGKPVVEETPDGKFVPVWRYDAANALRGYELLGKHLKLFTDKHEHTGADGEALMPATIQLVGPPDNGKK
jgi:phage terminase small subunit